jgi:hypothetical protein
MQNHGVRLMRLFCSLMGVHLVMLPRLHCEQRLILNRWSQILLGARGFAFSRFRRASAAWRRLGAFALSRETALARENADFSVSFIRKIGELRSKPNSVNSRPCQSVC